MKTIKYISVTLVCLFCVLTLLVGVAGYIFGDNIKAVILMMSHSKEELEVMLDETYSEVDEFLQTNSEYTVRPSGKVEEKLHHDNVINDEELKSILVGETEISDMFGAELLCDDTNNITNASTGEKLDREQLLQMKNQTTQNQAEQTNSPPKADESSPAQATGDPKPKKDNSEAISGQIAQMYVLKSTFTASLDALYTEAIARFDALPSSQKESGKTTIINELYPKAASLERQCDAQVKTVLAELTRLLREDGKSLELVEKIRTAYYQEKSVRKAMYMEKL